MPLNAFGASFEAAEHSWTRELCEADSDEDGLTNGEELGDPCCLWVKGSQPSEYTKRFSPSHPGVADLPATVAAYSRPACGETGPVVTGQRFGEFNSNEEQRTVEVRIKSFQVPPQRTTYVNFMINIPDSAWEGADMFYVVKADGIIDKKEVLHHYVINGCSKKVPEELDGIETPASTSSAYDCTTPFGGWAPGSHILNMPPWIGMPFGPSAGVVALDLQIHYDNPRKASDIVDASGMRFWFTPTPRTYPLTRLNSMMVSVNTQIVVPPKKERWFLTRTCTVDIEDEAGEPVQFHLYGVKYHAHLLGVQMYTEYFPVDGGVPLDLGSEHVWHFDDQGTRDMLALNITMKSGEVIQSSCVMNSMHLEEATVFGRETIDEMCWAQYLGWSSVPGHSAIVKCDGPMWEGELLSNEPGFGLARRRPVEKAIAAWDGSNVMTGGSALRLPSDDCVDSTPFFCARQVPNSLANSGADSCDKELANGMSFMEACCATTCAQMACHTTPACLEVKEKENQARAAAIASDTVVLQSDPYYSIRTMGCSSDARMLREVSVRLPDELLTDSAKAQGSENGDGEFKKTSETKSDGAGIIGHICLILPFLVGLTV